MNVREVASLLGVHTNTIYNYINTGQIAAYKKNGSWDIPEGEFIKLKKAQSYSPRAVIDSISLILSVLENEIKIIENLTLNWEGISSFNLVKKHTEFLNTKENLEYLKSVWYEKIQEDSLDSPIPSPLLDILSEEEAIDIYNLQKEIENHQSFIAEKRHLLGKMLKVEQK